MTENIVHRLWHTTPPITRTIFILSIITSFLVYIDIISPFTLQFSFHYISKLQLWRLITCFFYFGKLNLETIFHIIFLCRYSKMLEESMSISDYTYLVSIIMLLLYTINYFVYLRLSHALSAVITYLWARKNPFSHIQYMGCIVLHAFYLPFIVPLYSLLSERSMPRDDFIGIFVGHLVFYFKYIWPKMGNDFLRTPVWIKKMFNDYVPEEANEPKVQEIKEKDIREKDINGNGEKDINGKENKEKDIKKKDIVDSIDNGVDGGIDESVDESSECIDNKSCTSSTLREFDYPKSEDSSSSHFSNVDEHFGDRHEEIDSDIMSCDSTSSFHEPEEEGFDDSSDVLEEKFKEKSEEFEDW